MLKRFAQMMKWPNLTETLNSLKRRDADGNLDTISSDALAFFSGLVLPGVCASDSLGHVGGHLLTFGQPSFPFFFTFSYSHEFRSPAVELLQNQRSTCKSSAFLLHTQFMRQNFATDYQDRVR